MTAGGPLSKHSLTCRDFAHTAVATAHCRGYRLSAVWERRRCARRTRHDALSNIISAAILGSATIDRRIPGTGDDGQIDAFKLKAWIKDVRAQYKAYGREGVGDSCIGELLSKCRRDEGGIWPAIAVSEALEEIGNQNIANAMAIGLYNQRGAHWRDVDGRQERDLAAQYRGRAKQTAVEWPFCIAALGANRQGLRPRCRMARCGRDLAQAAAVLGRHLVGAEPPRVPWPAARDCDRPSFSPFFPGGRRAE
jgi:hypothetical protein